MGIRAAISKGLQGKGEFAGFVYDLVGAMLKLVDLAGSMQVMFMA